MFEQICPPPRKTTHHFLSGPPRDGGGTKSKPYFRERIAKRWERKKPLNQENSARKTQTAWCDTYWMSQKPHFAKQQSSVGREAILTVKWIQRLYCTPWMTSILFLPLSFSPSSPLSHPWPLYLFFTHVPLFVYDFNLPLSTLRKSPGRAISSTQKWRKCGLCIGFQSAIACLAIWSKPLFVYNLPQHPKMTGSVQ